jgi:hypothetical protein
MQRDVYSVLVRDIAIIVAAIFIVLAYFNGWG